MSVRSLRVLPVLVVLVLVAGCGGSATPEEDASERAGQPSSSLRPEGRILFSRAMASGAFLHFAVEADGSGETPFVPGREFEARNLSPDGSLLAISAQNEQGLFVGGTVGVDGTGYRLFANADPSLHLVCGVWAPRGRMACEGWDDSDASRAGIYTVRASNGSDPRRLTRHRDIPCEFSPDGTELAFIRTGADDARGTLMVMDAAGGTRVLCSLTWSSPGSRATGPPTGARYWPHPTERCTS